MSPRYCEIEHGDFMTLFVKVAAQDNMPGLSSRQMKPDFVTVSNPKRDSQMYDPLYVELNKAVRATKGHDRSRIRSYFFKNTSQWPEIPSEDTVPGLAMYPDTDITKSAFSLDMNLPASIPARATQEVHKACVAWAWMVIAVDEKNTV